MADSKPAVELRTKYNSLSDSLSKNQFKRPLVLESNETKDRFQGDVYATVDYSFAAVNTGLNNPEHWCDVMHLHINTKYCHVVNKPSASILLVNIGKKTPQDLADTSRVEFKYKVAAASTEFLEIDLIAKDGPMGSSDYNIRLEAIPLPNAKTFLHFSYGYTVNFSGRLAMKTYLATIASGKVGFTVVGKRADGRPDYIGGARGSVERNMMRYYLAIDAYLGTAKVAPAAQLDARLQNWYTASELFPRQLHEMDRPTYLEMKRAEYLRQQTEYD